MSYMTFIAQSFDSLILERRSIVVDSNRGYTKSTNDLIQDKLRDLGSSGRG